jgi:hypothetical protein
MIIIMWTWSSGYDVCLTRRRSRVQSSVSILRRLTIFYNNFLFKLNLCFNKDDFRLQACVKDQKKQYVLHIFSFNWRYYKRYVLDKSGKTAKDLFSLSSSDDNNYVDIVKWL